MLDHCRRCLTTEDAAELACSSYLAPLPAAQRTAMVQAVFASPGGGAWDSSKAVIRFNRDVLILGIMVTCPIHDSTADEMSDFAPYTSTRIDTCDRTWTGGGDSAAPFVWTPSLCLPTRSLNLRVGANDELGLTHRVMHTAPLSNVGHEVIVHTSIIYRPIGGAE